MGIVKNLPKLEQPREKAKRYGIENLSDIELLSILLGSGYVGSNAIEISTTLLNKYGGLKRLCEISVTELKTNKGIKEAKALILSAIFEIHKRINIKDIEEAEILDNETYLVKKYSQSLFRLHQEFFVIAILNKQGKIIYEDILYKGTENTLTISFEDIYRILIEYHAKSYYLLHNHVQGDSEPSEYDKIATNNIILQSKKHHIKLIDHLIISEKDYYSFSKMKKTTISC